MNLRKNYSIIGGAIKEKGLSGVSNLLLNLSTLIWEPLEVRSEPLFIQVEPTIECNLQCPTCMSPGLKREKRMLSLKDFQEILRQFPFVRKISLVGAGEPLLNPELFQIIRVAKNKGIAVGFATNATLLSEEVTGQILDCGLDWINISLDGAKKETYEKIRKGADFDQVVGNILRFMKLKAARKKPEVSLWFLALESNLNELPDMVDVAGILGINTLYMQSAHNWGSPERKGVIDKKKVSSSARMKEVIAGTMLRARQRKIDFSFVNVPDKKGSRICKWPWKSCYITVEGDVTPCCLHGADPQVVNFGNLYKDSFRGIWNSAGYRQFRKKLKSKNVPAICVDCPSRYTKVRI